MTHSCASEEQARAQVKRLQVASPYRISDHALTGKIRYELAFSEGAGGSLPETGEQHVEQRGDHLIATICRDRCGQEASAREAYDNRSGDCTEFAVLLAAAARARNIPTRLVAGLAYSSRFLGGQHVFGPHMWVQSWRNRLSLGLWPNGFL
jgi:hypothetical protein